jgi:hypothetical protein
MTLPRYGLIMHGELRGFRVIYLPGRRCDGVQYGGRPLLIWKVGK